VGPLDVVKARQQVYGLKYGGVRQAVRVIWRDEGVRGFYRGITPTLIGYIPTWAIFFSLNNKIKDELRARHPALSHHVVTISGALGAGAVTNIATNPIWVIRTRLQTQKHSSLALPEYHGTADCFRKMLSTEGVRAFYKGIVPNMYGLVHVAVQFPLYEELKDLGPQPPGGLHIICASSMSKAVAAVVTYPLEVVRSRMHVDKHKGGSGLSVLASLRKIFEHEGRRGLYAGLQTNLLRVVPACSLTFTTYEFCVAAYNHHRLYGA
jgi:solute carrier family 25 folate transporter 32